MVRRLTRSAEKFGIDSWFDWNFLQRFMVGLKIGSLDRLSIDSDLGGWITLLLKWKNEWKQDTGSSGREKKIMSFSLRSKNEVDHPDQSRGVRCVPVGVYRGWYILMRYLWCSSMSMYICRRSWRSPFNTIWCGGSILWWISVSTFNNVLDLWCQSMTSEVPLGTKNSIGTL